MSTLEHALEYCRRGWNPTPVKPRAKAPIGDEWQHRVITAETAPQFFSGADLNVGLVLGPSSKGLTDVDLDCAEALAIAPYVLSPTSARFGRPSKRESHWLYTTDLAATADKASLQFRDGKKMLVELRTGSDTLGAQTVAPGSTHESGEAISWSENGTPAVVDGDNLRQRVSALAAYALIARHWPVEGEGRHEAALSLGGFLARAGRKPEAIKVIAEAIAKAANDPHWKDRARAAQDSATATNQGKKAYGLPHLSELIGDSAKQAATWLGYSSKDADDNDDGDKKPKQADVLIALAADADLFHAPDGEAFADIPIDGHRETHRVRSQAFRQYLRHLYFKKARAGVNADAMQVAIETIAAKAVFEGEKHEVHIRVAELGDAIYIDIGNDSWRAIKVTAAGWQVVPSPPVRFQRSAGTRPLPTPQRGGSIQLLRPFCNVASKGDFVLLVAFALAVLRPNANYPVLVVTGEQGACKSTTIRFIVRLTDPRMPEQRSLPRDEDDLITAAKGSHLLPFDNVSGLVDWLSDAFCRLSTGGGAGKRRLYTDDDEVLFAGRRAICLNGIEDVAERADLIDRCVMLPHKPIAESKRRDERELEATFGIAAPEILGALLDGLAAGLRNLANVQMDDKPRMADFALWAEACTRAYWPADTFLKAYRDNLADSVELVLEASPVGIAVRTFMATRSEWKGAAGTLLPLLTALVGEQAAKERSWPKRGNELGGKLRRVTPALRKTGIHVVFERDGHARTIRIEARGQPEQRGDSSSWSSPSSPSEQKEGGINDVGTNPGDNGVPFDDSTMTSPDSDSVTASPLKSRGNDGCDGNDDDLHHSSGNGGSVPNDYDAVLEELVAQGWQPTAKVTIREIRLPAIAAGVDDDIEDINPANWRWRQ